MAMRQNSLSFAEIMEHNNDVASYGHDEECDKSQTISKLS